MLTFNRHVYLFAKDQETTTKSHLDPSIWQIRTYRTAADDGSKLFKHLLSQDSIFNSPHPLKATSSATPLEKNADSNEQTISAFIAQQNQKQHKKRAHQAQGHAKNAPQATTVDYRNRQVGAFLFKNSSF